MLSQPKNTGQISFFSSFEDMLNNKHPLYILANKISWKIFDDAFSKHYTSNFGRPAKPIRLMVSLLIIKQLRDISDENLVVEWSENVYYQYMSGEQHFVGSVPCSSTELVEFRKRIGKEGAELIFKESIRINGKDSDDDTLSADTTVQEKNITYPTDTKLHKKIITKCVGIARKEGLILKQTYSKTLKRLNIALRFQHNKNGYKPARKAHKRIKTIAGVLVRELLRKLDDKAVNRHQAQLGIYIRVLSQKRSDSNKIYSLHEPHTKCYTKGKEHKKFEFGSKVSILVTQKTGVIVGAVNFNENLHDSRTLPQAIEQYERLHQKKPKDIIADRGYRGPQCISDVAILTPTPPGKPISEERRQKHSRRAAIEPVFSHLKFDHRMWRNFLKGELGDTLNLLLGASAYNFKRVMNLWCTEAIRGWQFIYLLLINISWKKYAPELKMTF